MSKNYYYYCPTKDKLQGFAAFNIEKVEKEVNTETCSFSATLIKATIAQHYFFLSLRQVLIIRVEERIKLLSKERFQGLMKSFNNIKDVFKTIEQDFNFGLIDNLHPGECVIVKLSRTYEIIRVNDLRRISDYYRFQAQVCGTIIEVTELEEENTANIVLREGSTYLIGVGNKIDPDKFAKLEKLIKFSHLNINSLITDYSIE